MKEKGLLGPVGLQGGRKGFHFSAFCPCSLLVLHPLEFQGWLPCASQEAAKDPEEMLKKKKRTREGDNLWRKSEENRVRLVGNSAKSFPLPSAGGAGRGGISWGVHPAVALLTRPVLFPSSNRAGWTAMRQKG